MSAGSPSSLAEQRLALRGQLRAQRLDVAMQLFASRVRGDFPRSVTMRVLMRQPELVGRLVALIAGARLAGVVSTLLVGAQVLNSFSIVTARRLPDPPLPRITP